MSAAQFLTAGWNLAIERPREGVPFTRRMTSKRNCSASPRTALAVLGVSTIVLLGIGAFFAWLGLWLVLPFAGAEIAALAAALYVNGLHAGDYERFVFGDRGDPLVVETRDGTRVLRHVFDPQWARVVLRVGRRQVQVAIAARGRELAVGRHLVDDGRRALASELERGIAEARATRTA